MDENCISRLEALRELTHLSPVDYVRIANAKKKDDKLAFSHENFETGMEHCSANELEYFIRLNKFSYMIEPSWHEYTKVEHDCFSLLEFAENVLDNFVAEKLESNARRR